MSKETYQMRCSKEVIPANYLEPGIGVVQGSLLFGEKRLKVFCARNGLIVLQSNM